MELPGKRELREQILHQMDGRTSYVSDKDVYREIDKAILRSSHGGYGTLSEKEELRRQMFYSIRGFDVLEKYLGDSSISEIMVIGASRIFVEQNGKIRRIEEHFSEEGDVYRLIEQIVAPTNRMVNEACPIVDSRLPDGSRVHIVLPPVSLEGPVITIRKFLKGGMTIEKLLAFEEFPEKLTGILSALVKSRYNILISGATNSGKSSLLNALAEYIGKRERVITIEDSAELQLFHVENLVRLETRNANMEGENEITMLHGKSAINQKYLTIIQDGLTVYADKIMNNLRSLKINFDLTQFVFIGGGASIIKNFSSDLGENMLIVEDVCINAKGYKDILEHKYKVVV